jgi:hypothetical protein
VRAKLTVAKSRCSPNAPFAKLDALMARHMPTCCGTRVATRWPMRATTPRHYRPIWAIGVSSILLGHDEADKPVERLSRIRSLETPKPDDPQKVEGRPSK